MYNVKLLCKDHSRKIILTFWAVVFCRAWVLTCIFRSLNECLNVLLDILPNGVVKCKFRKLISDWNWGKNHLGPSICYNFKCLLIYTALSHNTNLLDSSTLQDTVLEQLLLKQIIEAHYLTFSQTYFIHCLY